MKKKKKKVIETGMPTDGSTVIIPLCGRGISEETFKIMAEAQGRLCDKISQGLKDGTDELIVINPKASLLPSLEYIGDGKYRFKKKDEGDEHAQ